VVFFLNYKEKASWWSSTKEGDKMMLLTKFYMCRSFATPEEAQENISMRFTQLLDKLEQQIVVGKVGEKRHHKKCANFFCEWTFLDRNSSSNSSSSRGCLVVVQPQKLRLCHGCRCAYYCSKMCQRLDWVLHRPACIHHQSLLEDELESGRRVNKMNFMGDHLTLKFQRLLTLAREKDVVVLRELLTLLRYRLDNDKDEENILDFQLLLFFAATWGCEHSLIELGKLVATKKHFDMTEECFKKLISMNKPIGWTYLGELEIKRNPRKSLKCYERAAELGCTQAMAHLSNSYACGINKVKKDRFAAASYALRAAFGRNLNAESYYGWCLYVGHGVAVNKVQARIFVERAAKRDDARALLMLGKIVYLQSTKTPEEKKKNVEKAKKLIHRSYNLGNLLGSNFAGVVGGKKVMNASKTNILVGNAELYFKSLVNAMRVLEHDQFKVRRYMIGVSGEKEHQIQKGLIDVYMATSPDLSWGKPQKNTKLSK